MKHVSPRPGSRQNGHVSAVLRSQAGWMTPAFGVGAAITTYLALGWWGVLGLLFTLMAIGLVAQQRHISATAAPPPPPPLPNVDSPTDDQQRDMASRDEGLPSEVAAATTEAAQGDEPPDEPETDSFGDIGFASSLAAAMDRDVKNTRELSDAWIAETQEEEERYERRVLKELLLVRAGDATALERLTAYADESPQNVWTQERLAQAFRVSGSVRRAATELKARGAQVSDPADRAQLAIVEAEFRKQLGELETARDLCALAIRDGRPPTVAAGHRQLGDCLLDDGQTLAAVAHWNQALHLEPTNDRLRFDLAYRAGDVNLEDLAIVNYLALHHSGAATSAALNNLGNELRERNARLTGTGFFRKAVEGGSAIAAGNLAHALVDAGFGDEASTWLAKGEELEDASARLASAQQKLLSEKSAETTRIEALQSNGRAIEAFLLEWLATDSERPPAGDWMAPDGVVWSFSEDGDEIIGSRAESPNKYRIQRGPSGLHVIRVFQYSPDQTGLAAITSDRLRLLFPHSGATDAELLDMRPVES